MDFIILNSDGSLQKQSLTRYIQQGSHGVDEIFIGWVNATSSQTLQTVFTLPNQLTNTELGVFEEDYEYEPGETMSGWVITLTENQTRYNGALMVSARIILNGIVQVAYPFALIINETGVRPETDSGITLAQLDSYLLNIQNLVTGAVRQNTDAALSSTSENPVQNKVVKQAIDDAIAGVYKVQGSANISTLNGLTKSESLNGYVYNCLDAGTLTNSTDTTSVQEGDNVVFVWNEGTWYWDRLAGVVDTSNLVTLNTDQTITGIKTFEGDLKFKGVGVSTVGQITTTSYSVKIGFGGVNHISIDGSAFYTNVANYDLGSSSHSWNKLYLSNGIYLTANWYIHESTSGVIYLENLGQNTGLKFERDKLFPETPNYTSLGTSSKKFKNLYLSGTVYTNYISDGTNSISVANIVTKVDPDEKLDVGVFDANGEITIAVADLEQDLNGLGWGQELHGIYMLTYAYAQTIMYLDKTQIADASDDGLPVRATMPVVYNALLGSSVPGNIRVQKVGNNYVFRVSDGAQHAAQGLHLYMIKTDLVQ